jgi:hypothetical protein
VTQRLGPRKVEAQQIAAVNAHAFILTGVRMIPRPRGR